MLKLKMRRLVLSGGQRAVGMDPPRSKKELAAGGLWQRAKTMDVDRSLVLVSPRGARTRQKIRCQTNPSPGPDDVLRVT